VGADDPKAAGLRIGIAAGALALLGFADVLFGLLRSNHQSVIPGLLALALAVAVWQRSFAALVIASIVLAINAIGGAVAYGWPAVVLVSPFLAATAQALPVVRSLSKTPRPSTPAEQDP